MALIEELGESWEKKVESWETKDEKRKTGKSKSRVFFGMKN